ncbi:hypothetical protein ES703_64857 [subsurface metagenome]
MDATDIISTIKDVFLGLSAVAVAIFAWLGLRTWRKELTGRAKFEFTRSMMHSCFELRAKFAGVRHPITKLYEWAERVPADKETEAEAQQLNEWYAKTQRLNLVIESLNKIIEGEWEAKILLDESSIKLIEEAVQSYRESYADLSSAISTYFDITHDEARTGEQYQNQEWLRGLKKTIYSAPNDDFSKKVDDTTDKLSSALKQYVK